MHSLQMNESTYKSRLINIILLFFITKIGLLSFISFFYDLIPINTAGIQYNFVSTVAESKIGNMLIPWDGQWFLDIAKNGYPIKPSTEAELSRFVVFPAYPYVIRSVSSMLPISSVVTGITVNLIASLVGSIYLYKLAKFKFDDSIAERSVWYFLINPTAIFFLAVYSESLFFCLSVMSLYYAEKKKWPYAGLLGFLATLTRSVGILLIIPLTLTLLKEKQKSAAKLFISIFCISLIPFAYWLFSYYSSKISGSSTTYTTAQQAFGRSAPSFSNATNLLTHVVVNFKDYPSHSIFFSKLDVIWMTAVVLIVFISRRFMPLGYLLYCLGFVGLTLSSGTMTGIIRYTAVAFPLYINLAYLSRNNPNLHSIILLVSILLQALFAILYTHWYWVS